MTLKGKIMFASVATSTMTIRRVEMQSTLDRLVETLRLGRIAQRQRQERRGMDEPRLADIRLPQRAPLAEANRPFWGLRASWCC